MVKFDAALHVELWKATVEVQQHFNDIGWRIRGLAITALTFALGASFFGYLNAAPVWLVWRDASPASLVPLLGIGVWCIFWFADGVWYHRLLLGAREAASNLEALLRANGVEAELSTQISKSSPWRVLGVEVHSTTKLTIFYALGVTLLLLLAACLYFLEPQAALVAPTKP